MRSIVLYGLGGADTQYAPIRFEVIPMRDYSIDGSRSKALEMVDYNPTIQYVYEIDNYYWVASDYRNAAFDKGNSIEARAVFRDLLERRGRRIYPEK